MGNLCYTCPISKVAGANLCTFNKDVPKTEELMGAAASPQKTPHCPDHCFLKDLQTESPNTHSAALAGLPQHSLQGGQVLMSKMQHHLVSGVPQSLQSKNRLRV